jgi:hypothetical protein
MEVDRTHDERLKTNGVALPQYGILETKRGREDDSIRDGWTKSSM